MTAEERFEAWWARLNLPDDLRLNWRRAVLQYDSMEAIKHDHKQAWFACEAARDAEIERVAAELKAVKPDSNIQNDYQEGANDGAIEARHDAVRRLRSLLPARKAGE